MKTRNEMGKNNCMYWPSGSSSSIRSGSELS